mgnify:CR=1 FL=1
MVRRLQVVLDEEPKCVFPLEAATHLSFSNTRNTHNQTEPKPSAHSGTFHEADQARGRLSLTIPHTRETYELSGTPGLRRDSG